MEEETPSQPVPGKPSQVPSWVMLGFILGALFVLALPRRSPVEPESRTVREVPPAKPATAVETPQITTIEAVFASWDKYAMWSNDTTEVALWNSDTKGFSDCYEVLRVGDAYYFRSIPRLTRPILAHGMAEGSPLEFTETVRQRSEWLSEVGKENLKALSESVNQQFGAPTPEPPGK
jgi:hypothetical protein